MTQRSNDGTDNREKNSKSAREVYLESAKISGKVRCLFLSLGFFLCRGPIIRDKLRHLRQQSKNPPFSSPRPFSQFRCCSTRLDIRIKSQKHDCNGGGAPSEDPRELRRSPTLKRECAKRGIVHTKNDEKNENNGTTIVTSTMNT